MKHFSILLTIFTLTANSFFAQTTEENEIYPDNYTFEKAEDFQKKGEYEKAIWFYINLFPENKIKVVETVKKLAAKLDTVDMSFFIKTSFAQYVIFDPAIKSKEDGSPSMDMGKLKQKGAWGDELIQKISDPNKPLTSASEYNFRGLDKVNAGSFKEAIEDFDKAIEIKPTGQTYFNRAYSKSMIEDFDGAIQDYKKSIELEYRLAESYFERGYCKEQVNNPDGAMDDYTKAIETNKDYVSAYNNRALIKLKRNEYKAAIKDFDKAIKINPNFVGAYVNRGFTKKELGDNSGACKDWTKAVELGYKQANEFVMKYCE